MPGIDKSVWIGVAMDRHQGSLIRYANWILGDLETAREVVQDTFLRLCRQEPSAVDGHLAQWLFTVCRNLAFDVRKKETRMTPLDTDDMARVAADGPRPLAVLERKESLGKVQRIIETLPRNQREVIYLKFQSDLRYKEIASVTNLSVTNVGFLIHTAIKTIRRRMDEEATAPVRRRAQ